MAVFATILTMENNIFFLNLKQAELFGVLKCDGKYGKLGNILSYWKEKSLSFVYWIFSVL